MKEVDKNSDVDDLPNEEVLDGFFGVDEQTGGNSRLKRSKAENNPPSFNVPLDVNDEIETLSEQERNDVYNQLVNELTYLQAAEINDPGITFLLAMLQVPVINRAFGQFFGRPSSLFYEGASIAGQRKLLLDAVTLKPPGSQDKLHWFSYQEETLELVDAWQRLLKPAKHHISNGDLCSFLNEYLRAFRDRSDFYPDWVSKNQQPCDYLVYRDRAKALYATLNSTVVGQSRALDGLCDGYAQARLNVGAGPRGIFTLMGEPGTGKTLLAESFARHLEEVEGEPFEFLRFDMQQYTDEKSIMSLFGAGHFYTESSMGELTTPVYCYPKTVILFDEIEKAHPSIIQSLLSVLDRGISQDSTSLKWVDFSQTFILFTTNLGCEQLSQRRENGQVLGTLDNASLGSLLGRQQGNNGNGLSPEFINRLGKGRFLVFESLSPEHLLQIYKTSWNKCSGALENLGVDAVDCSSELATMNLLKRLPDLSARTASSAAESDIVALLKPILEAYENSDLLDSEFNTPVRVEGLDQILKEYLSERDLDQPESVLIVDDDPITEQILVEGCSKAQFAIKTSRIEHHQSIETASKESCPEIILVDLFIENDESQLKTTQALNMIMQLRSRFSEVPIIVFCRNPGRSVRTKEALEAAKSIDGVTAVLTYQSNDQQNFVDKMIDRLKHRRLARLVQAVIRERKRLQFNWHAQAMDDHIRLEATLTRLEPVLTPGEEGQIFGLGEIPDINFEDVVGNERGLRQISRAIGWLQHPGRIGRFGFRPPGGYLLAGPPGTGKTFLARAAAGSCGLPFFSLNAADLLAPASGMAESKLRKLFSDARRLAPSIIFIDEIDAIARQRGSGGSHGLVNTLLGEMDGFAGHARPVLILAATNFPESLDSALTRPGRFDETIVCDLPNREAREHLIRKGIERLALFLTDEDEEKLVLRTQGQSAAAIEAAIRHAVYIADGEDRDPEAKDIVEAFEQRVYGTVREDLTLAKEEKWSTACHEAGHALVMHLLLPGISVDYITIQPRTGSLGFVAVREDSSNANGQLGMTRNEITRQMAVCLAGREAERIMLGESGMSTGAGSDLMKANNLARAAVMRLGLDSEIGPLRIEPEQLSADPALAEVCHRRVRAWLIESEQDVQKLLQENKTCLEALATKLSEAESIEKEEFLALMKSQSE